MTTSPLGFIAKDFAYFSSGIFAVETLTPILATLQSFAHPTVIAAIVTGLFLLLARFAEIRFTSEWRRRALDAEAQLKANETHGW